MKIDRAADAFRAASEKYVLLETMTGWAVREEDGTVHMLGGPVGHTEDEANALAQQLAGRDGVEAVLREMISPAVLKNAAHHAGVRIEKVENNRLNLGCSAELALLKGIIALLEQEAH